MLQKFKESWQHFKEVEPGRRFQDRYEKRQCECQGKFDLSKVVNIVAGVVVTALGLFMMPAPGPGAPIVIVGLSLIGSEFRPLACFLDKVEVRLRPLAAKAKHIFDTAWARTSLAVKASIALGMVSGAGIAAYVAYQLFLSDARGMEWIKLMRAQF